MIRIKRVYENKQSEDGPWILVERLWPRGIRKEKIDLWLKDIAPSAELRVWFSHDPIKWNDFRHKYELELRSNPSVKRLLELAKKGDITMVYAASDNNMNSAIVLKGFIDSLS